MLLRKNSRLSLWSFFIRGMMVQVDLRPLFRTACRGDLPWGRAGGRLSTGQGHEPGELPDEAEHAQGHRRATAGQQTGGARSVQPPAKVWSHLAGGLPFLALHPLTSMGWMFLVPRPLGGPKCPLHHAPVHPGLCLEGSRPLPMVICLNVSRDSSGGARGRGQA